MASPKRNPRTRKPRAPAPAAAARVRQPELPGIATHLDLRPYKTIRLAVSGDVALNRLETRLLDTADFQRLRGIRQLGPAAWVFPTALHTRFDHSLGTLAMVDRMIRELRGNFKYPDFWREVSPEQELLARLLALLHDVTHIPFGHTIEDECCVLPRHDRDQRRLDRFLGESSPLGRILLRDIGRELYDRLFALMRAAPPAVPPAAPLADRLAAPPVAAEDHFILDLVTGALGADLLDYLRRDASFCNIALDADYRFLRYLSIVPHEGRRRLVVRLWKEGAAPAPPRRAQRTDPPARQPLPAWRARLLSPRQAGRRGDGRRRRRPRPGRRHAFARRAVRDRRRRSALAAAHLRRPRRPPPRRSARGSRALEDSLYPALHPRPHRRLPGRGNAGSCSCS
jgi:hypothetical protein